MEYTNLGTRIRKAREKQALTQSQLANRIGVKRNTIERWENEQSVPRINKLATMAGVLDVPLLWLLAGGDFAPTTTEHSTDAIIEQKLQLANQHLEQLTQLLNEIKILAKKQADFTD